MTRPGFVLDVDRSTPPILFWHGAQLITERLPSGARVIYPPEPLTPVADPDGAVRSAIENPVDGDPLTARLKPGMRLTIAFDDLSAVVPAMQRPDVRQRVIEAVLTLAAAARVDDVRLILARGFNRRLTNNELRHMLGDRIYESFVVPGLLSQHDAEDEDNLVSVKSASLNKRVAESDLLVYVSVNAGGTERASGELLTGLAGARTIIDRSATGTDNTLLDGSKIFHIATTLNNNAFGGALSFLQRRANEWTFRDRLSCAAVTSGLDALPARTRRSLFHSHRAPLGLTGVFAGSLEAAHKAAITRSREQTVVDVESQTDVLTMGIPSFSPAAANSMMNPVLVAFAALGQNANLNMGRSLVREGGAVIIHHPTPAKFNPVHQPSTIDFYERVLDGTNDLSRILEQEERFATDRWYSHLYRTSYAHHGALPFGQWRAIAKTMDHLNGVIVVGGNPAVAHRLGFRSASTFTDALEMSRDITGSSGPSVTHLHAPPPPLAKVS